MSPVSICAPSRPKVFQETVSRVVGGGRVLFKGSVAGLITALALGCSPLPSAPVVAVLPPLAPGIVDAASAVTRGGPIGGNPATSVPVVLTPAARDSAAKVPAGPEVDLERGGATDSGAGVGSGLATPVVAQREPFAASREAAFLAADPSGVITSHWGELYLNGAPYRFLSLVSPAAATDWQVNFGCGLMATDAQLDAFFASLPPHTLVPFWATQALAFNDRTSDAIDFSGIDRVFDAAARYGQYLLPELEHQQGYCSDGHWKDISWYEGGYRQAFDTDGRGLEPLSYWQYLQLIVSRYRSSPALGMWGLVIEPEAQTCDPGTTSDCAGRSYCNEEAAEQALRGFFDSVGAEVKRLDPNHLITAGSVGGGQCGWAGIDFGRVNAGPGIDVCEVHDYNPDEIPITPEAQADIQVCEALGKPLIVGETGLNAGPTSGVGCPETDDQRATSFRQRISAYFSSGASGVALWDWASAVGDDCGFGIPTGDPVVSVLGDFGL